MESNASQDPVVPAPIWRFVAPRDISGRPTVFYDGIPARDLVARDVARLTADQLAVIEQSPLYRANVPDDPPEERDEQ